MRRKSLFRQGLEGILRLLNNPHLPSNQREEFADWLKSPFLIQNFIVECEFLQIFYFSESLAKKNCPF